MWSHSILPELSSRKTRLGFTEVVLEVADDGPGFPDGTTDRVFDRFWRADGSRARTSGGSGLGLAIVAAVVRSHGGSAVAGRAPEGGALVSIRLPAVG